MDHQQPNKDRYLMTEETGSKKVLSKAIPGIQVRVLKVIIYIGCLPTLTKVGVKMKKYNPVVQR